MTIHRASCTDCPWRFEDEDLIEVSDELERHSQKEQHHVDMQRAVATDGGRPAPGAEAGSLDLTAFQQNILVILSEEPMYGLAIKRELESYYKKEVNHGRLYPNLDDLVDDGLVEKSELDKRTNQYELTGAGEHVIEDQLRWIFSKYAADEEGPERVHDLVDEGTEDSR